MALFQISETGTRTTGASTADDWSDANCYNAGNVTGISEANGDVFTFDAGTYNLTAQLLHTSGTTLNARGNGPVYINGAAVAYGLQLSGGSGETVFIGDDIIIGAGDTTTAPLHFPDRGAAYDISLGDVVIADGGSFYGMLLACRGGNFSASKLTLRGAFTQYCINTTSALANDENQTITIDWLHFDDVVAGSNSALYGIRTQKADATFTLDITIGRITGSIDGVAQGASVNLGSIDGCTNLNVDIDDQIIINTPSGKGMQVIGSAGTGTNQHVVWASVRSKTGTGEVVFNSQAGDAVEFGVDTIADAVIDHECYGLTITGSKEESGSPHGITNRNLSKGRNFANVISGFHSPIMHSECSDDELMSYGNLIYDCYGVGLSFKGNSASIMANNTVVITPTSFGGSLVAYGIWVREQISANTGGRAFNNDIIFLGVSKENMFVLIGTGDAMTELSANNYFTDQTLPAAPWSDDGTDYANLAAWNAGHETQDATDVRNFTSEINDIIAAFGYGMDYTPHPDSEILGKGVQWWTAANPRPTGLGIKPFPDRKIDIGAIQSSHDLMHPANTRS